MKPLSSSNRIVIGLVLLLLALLLLITAASLVWGLAGAIAVAGITLAIYAIGFFVSTAE